MAREDKELDSLDDIDKLLDDLDMDDEVEPPKSGREAIERVLKSAGKEVKSTVVNPEKITKTVAKALPPELGTVSKLTTEVPDTITDVYREATQEVKKVARPILTLADRAIPSRFSRVKEKIKSLLEEDSGSSGIARETVEDKVNKLLPDVEESNKYKELYKDTINLKQSLTQNKLLATIAAGTESLLNFSTSHVSRYQRKSLELRYKSYFILKEQFQLLKSYFQTSKLQLEAIVRNTGIPDTLKYRAPDAIKEAMRIQSSQKVVSGLFNRMGWLENISKNIRNKVLGSLRDTTSIIEELQGLGEQTSSLGGDKYTTAGQVIGSGALGFLSGVLAKRLTGRNKNLARKLVGVNEKIRNLPDYLATYLESEDAARSPLKASLARSLLGLIGGEGEVATTVTTERPGYDLDKPAIFDTRVKTSIVEIIPNILSKIFGEIRSLRTGEEPQEYRYDWRKRELVIAKELRKRVRSELRETISTNNAPRYIEQVVDSIMEANPDLTGADRGLIRRRLLDALVDNKATSVAGLKRRKVKEGAGGKKFIQAIDKWVDKIGLDVANTSIEELRVALPDVRNVIKELIDRGYLNDLLQLGVVTVRHDKVHVNLYQYKKLLREAAATSNLGSDAYKAINRIPNQGSIEITDVNVKSKIKEKANKVGDLLKDKLDKTRQYAAGKAEAYGIGSRITDAKDIVRRRTQEVKGELRAVNEILNDPEQRKQLTKEAIAKLEEEKEKAKSKLKILRTLYREKVENIPTEQYKNMFDEFKEKGRSAIVAAKEKLGSRIKDVKELTETERQKFVSLLDKVKLERLYEKGILHTIESGTTVVDTEKLNMLGTTKKMVNEGPVNLGGTKSKEEELEDKKKESGGLLTKIVEDINNKFGIQLEGMAALSEQLSAINESIQNIKLVEGDVTMVSHGKLSGKIGKYGKTFINKLTDYTGKAYKTGFDTIKGFAGIGGKFTKNVLGMLKIPTLSGIVGKLTGTANSLVAYLTAPIAMLKDLSTSILSKAFGLSNLPVKLAKNIGSKAVKAVSKYLFGDKDKPIDLYIPGRVEPVIRANLIKMGIYVDANTGKVIRRLSDITGPVVDREGNIVLSMSDITKGIFDANGKEVALGKALKKGVIGVLQDIYGKGKKILKGGIKGALGAVGLNISREKFGLGSKDKEASTGFASKKCCNKIIKLLTSIDKQLVKMTKAIKSGDGMSIGGGTGSGIMGSVSGLMPSLSTLAMLFGGKKLAGKFMSKLGFKELLKIGGKKLPIAGTLVGGLLGAQRAFGGDFTGAGAEVASGLLSNIPGVGTLLSTIIDLGLIARDSVTEDTVEEKPPYESKIYGGRARRRQPQYKKAQPVGPITPPDISGRYNPSDVYIPHGAGSVKIKPIPVLTTPLMDGSEGWKYITGPDAKDLVSGKMNPAVVKNFLGMAMEYGLMMEELYRREGRTDPVPKIYVTSAYRSHTEQRRAYRQFRLGRKKATVARPGTSMHEYGLALDICNHKNRNCGGEYPTATVDDLEEMGLMRKYGFTRPVRNEDWHLEPIMVALNHDRCRKDPDFAASATMASLGKGGGGKGSDRTYANYPQKALLESTISMSNNKTPDNKWVQLSLAVTSGKTKVAKIDVKKNIKAVEGELLPRERSEGGDGAYPGGIEGTGLFRKASYRSSETGVGYSSGLTPPSPTTIPVTPRPSTRAPIEKGDTDIIHGISDVAVSMDATLKESLSVQKAILEEIIALRKDRKEAISPVSNEQEIRPRKIVNKGPIPKPTIDISKI